MMVLRLFIYLILFMRMNCGIVVSWVGSKNVVRIIMKSMFLLGKLNLVKVKVVSDEMSNISIDIVVVMRVVLVIVV